MLNDRDDKYENPEESEYHFSEEDLSYEVDTETPKPVVASDQKESFLNRITRSKRMLIAGAVFLVLVFVVYKMVAPTSQPEPATDIRPNVVSTNPPSAVTTTTQTLAPTTPSVTTAPSTQLPPVTVTTTAPAQVVPVVSPTPPVVSQTTTTVTQPLQPTSTSQVNNLTPEQMVARQQSAMTMPTSMPAAAPVQAPSQPVVSNQIPSQVPVSQMTAPTSTPSSTPANSLDAGLAVMAATNEKLMSQLQTEYAQKLNDYAAQSKAMQEQMQTLNTRMAGVESQLNQLIQHLNRQPTAGATPSEGAQPAAAPTITPDTRSGYSVQAIIPGRAWLKSDNGDTLTVAEGDAIKDLGRVTKIDPYDGVVEINTGSRTISLSYGNGG